MTEKNLLRMCCVCKKIEINDVWVGNNYLNYQKQVDKHDLTHGYCPICFEKIMKDMEEFKKKEDDLF